jgi:hypothetical protein
VQLDALGFGFTDVCPEQAAPVGCPAAAALQHTAVVHLLVNGVRLKTVPSRLTVAHRLADAGAWRAPTPRSREWSA